MNDSRLLLQEFHTLVSEYGEKMPMTKMYRDSLIRRIEAELACALAPEVDRRTIICPVEGVCDADDCRRTRECKRHFGDRG